MYVKYIHKELSNGQIATVVLQEDCWAPEYTEISFVIGKSRKANKDWYKDKINYRSIKSTGACGLEGLLFALSIIKDLQAHKTPITIEFADSRRERVYQYLCRYGFKPAHYTEHPDTRILYWKA